MKYKNNKDLKQIKTLTSNKINALKFVIKYKEEQIKVFHYKGKEGWVDENNNIINYGYDKCFSFQGGFARFKRKTKYGLINIEGKVLIEGFDWCDNFQDGFAKFRKNNKEGLIDSSGKIVVERFN